MEKDILKNLQAEERRLVKLYEKGEQVGQAIEGVRVAIKHLTERERYHNYTPPQAPEPVKEPEREKVVE